MAAPTTIPEQIDQAAVAGVKSVSVDGVSVTKMDVDELIKADQYAKTATASAKNHFGLRLAVGLPYHTQ